jgi:formate hydrogenlyase subunit 6/NADH:ubiquinone oxidoreductase subunit I
MRPGKMIREVLRSVFKKPATNLYPFEKLDMPENYRGKLIFDATKCVGCMKDCPSGAITINKVGEKQFEAVLDLARCMYCAQCVDSCLKKALFATSDVELAQLDVKKLKVILSGDNPGFPKTTP